MEVFRKNILIICEGEGAEPNYFNFYRNKIIEQKLDVNIVVRPKPKSEEIEAVVDLRKGAKIRQLKQVLKEPTGDIVEEAYRSQPTRYVREAQLGLEENTFDEVWAVYDKDGHASQEEAFNLSQVQTNGKIVNVGFTSIAFEYWILLHFQLNKTPFVKAMCREGRPGRTYWLCGSNIYDQDCGGTNCVCGQIVTNEFLNYSNGKKDFAVSEYAANVNDAILRAIDLRKSLIGNPAPFYDQNPYTNIDRLVFKLLHLKTSDYHFFNQGVQQSTENISLAFSKQPQQVDVEITLIKDQTFILNEDSVVLVDINGVMHNITPRTILSPENNLVQISLSSEQYNNLNPIYIGLKAAPNTYNISEL